MQTCLSDGWGAESGGAKRDVLSEAFVGRRGLPGQRGNSRVFHRVAHHGSLENRMDQTAAEKAAV